MTPKASEAPVEFKEIIKTDCRKIGIRRTFYSSKEVLSLQNFWRYNSEEPWDFGKAVTFSYEDIDDIIEGLQAMKKWCKENS